MPLWYITHDCRILPTGLSDSPGPESRNLACGHTGREKIHCPVENLQRRAAYVRVTGVPVWTNGEEVHTCRIFSCRSIESCRCKKQEAVLPVLPLQKARGSFAAAKKQEAVLSQQKAKGSFVAAKSKRQFCRSKKQEAV